MKKILQINTSAVDLAKKASAGKQWVAGSVGPLGKLIEPYGKISYEDSKDIFQEQIKILINSGVDLITLETFINPMEIKQAILAVRSIDKSIPIIAFLTKVDDYFNKKQLNEIIDINTKLPIDAFGLNCSLGPQLTLKCLEKIYPKINMPLAAKPNAGLPRTVDGRQIYMSTPEYLAKFTQDSLQLGVSIIGGCCGTSPAHINSMSNAIKHSSALKQNRSADLQIKDLTKDNQPKEKNKFCT